MRAAGTHTFDIDLEYLRCPHCGVIVEDRQRDERRLDAWVKECQCPRCDHFFTVEKRWVDGHIEKEVM